MPSPTVFYKSKTFLDRLCSLSFHNHHARIIVSTIEYDSFKLYIGNWETYNMSEKMNRITIFKVIENSEGGLSCVWDTNFVIGNKQPLVPVDYIKAIKQTVEKKGLDQIGGSVGEMLDETPSPKFASPKPRKIYKIMKKRDISSIDVE